MSIFDRGLRGNVQSPFTSVGDASSIGYSNPRLPQSYGGNSQLALDYLIDALYPNYKGTVPTKADLPSTANVNDYYIVSDDGDGKSAGYVYSSLEGMTSWVKRYDVDYSAEGVLAEAMDRTSYQYVSKYGSSDKDADGNPVTGPRAGQTIFGGKANDENLTLFANAADMTGVINFGNTLMPLVNGLDIGSTSNQFQNAFLAGTLTIGGLTVYTNNISQLAGTGALSIDADLVSFSQGVEFQSNALFGSTLTIGSGQISDSSGSINFGTTQLSTTGNITAGSLNISGTTVLGDFQFGGNQIYNVNSIITFNYANLSQISSLYANKLMSPEIDVANTTITDGVIATTANTLKLQPAQSVQILGAASVTAGLGVGGNVTFGGMLNISTSLQVGSAVKLSTDSSGNGRFESLQNNLVFASAGVIQVGTNLTPTSDNLLNLGTTSARFKTGYFSSGLSDGTNTVSIQSLLSLRDINTGATSGMSLFYNGSEWLPSIPDSEIVHSTLSGLTTGDAGHTQFALLAGRAGGQQLFGGSASGENLTLDSTSNATKGLVLTSSTFAPATTSAIDIGTTAKQFRNLYSSGLHYGLRFEQYAGQANYPANASATIGHVIWDTSSNQLLVDNGTSWSKVGNQKWLSDISMDGSTTSYSVTVSSSISDARTGMWQLLDNSNGFGQVYTTITKTQNTVTVTASPALPAGSYRLVGFN